MEVYEPAEDSEFFRGFLLEKLPLLLEKNPNLKFLEVGSGSGFLLETVFEFLDKMNIWACDINPNAVKICKEKGFNCVKSDLFSDFNRIKWDIIIFNAPYLPLDRREPLDSQIATTGGELGDEISVRFIQQAKDYLNNGGKIFLLVSSLTPLNRLKEFNFKIVARKKLFMEELLILEF
jgi:HemK-related putative methylase